MAGSSQQPGFSERDSPATAGSLYAGSDEAAAGANQDSPEGVHHPVREVQCERELPHSLLNIQGLLGQGGRGKARFLADLATRHHSLVTMLTETWLSDQVLSSEITVNIPGYSLYRCDRGGR